MCGKQLIYKFKCKNLIQLTNYDNWFNPKLMTKVYNKEPLNQINQNQWQFCKSFDLNKMWSKNTTNSKMIVRLVLTYNRIVTFLLTWTKLSPGTRFLISFMSFTLLAASNWVNLTVNSVGSALSVSASSS